MKRILILCFSLLICCAAQAEEGLYVYGVDYSHTKVYGAGESVNAFAEAFSSINELLLTQASKYDFSKMLGRSYECHNDVMIAHNNGCDFSDLYVRSNEVPELVVSEIVKNYTLPHTEGVGLVLIGRLLDKSQGEGHYYIVLFDVASRQLIYQGTAVVKAGGFGLRNYWANTIYQIVKKARYQIPLNL